MNRARLLTLHSNVLSGHRQGWLICIEFVQQEGKGPDPGSRDNGWKLGKMEPEAE